MPRAKLKEVTEPIVNMDVPGLATVTRPKTLQTPKPVHRGAKASSNGALSDPTHKGLIYPEEYHEHPYMNLLVNATESDKRRILVGVPMTGLIRVEWAMARWGQIIPTNWGIVDCLQYISQVTPLGYDVANARNIIAHVAMERGFEWLLFIDSDTIPPPDAFIKFNDYMRKGDIPVVCGLYFCKSDPPEPLVYRGRMNSYFRDFKIGEKFWIDGIPMGMTLIKVDILRAMAKDAPSYVAGGNVTCQKIFDTPQFIWTDPESPGIRTMQGTEDLAWCDRVMKGGYLEKAGFPKMQKKKYPFLCDSSIFAFHIDMNGVKYPLRFEW